MQIIDGKTVYENSKKAKFTTKDICRVMIAKLQKDHDTQTKKANGPTARYCRLILI